MSLERVVIICLASIHTALVSSPSLTVFFTLLPTYLPVCVCVTPVGGTEASGTLSSTLAPEGRVVLTT